MKMDRTSSDHSPTLSDNVGGSWMQYWETEFSSLSGLSIDRSSELHKLVEDKEIAARAVAFVVSSSRKGIVPLCADVAQLFRAKKSLECRLLKCRGENEVLRHASTSGSAQTSHSASPTPPSLHSLSDRRSLQDQSSQTQGSPRTYSSCSQSSSVVNSSPKVSKFHKINSTQSVRQRAATAAAVQSYVDNNGQLQTVVTEAQVHHVTKNGMCTASAVVDIEPELCDRDLSRPSHPLSRKNSLPEIISQPCGNVPKVSPRAIKCKGTQCSLVGSAPNSSTEEQLRETLNLNSKLTEELGAARKEIEILRGRLKELEMNNNAQHLTSRFYTENDCEAAVNGESVPSDDEQFFMPVIQKPSISRSSPQARTTKRSFSCPFTLPGPLMDCLCDMCEALVQTGNAQIHLRNGMDKKCVASCLQIRLNDYIVVKGKRTGYVRYIGHLDNRGQPNAIFVGLELDAPVGNHSGCCEGKRYFECGKDRGIFLPLQEVICIVRQQQKNSKTPGTEICKKRSLKEERTNRLDVGKLPMSPKLESAQSTRKEGVSPKLDSVHSTRKDRDRLSPKLDSKHPVRKEGDRVSPKLDSKHPVRKEGDRVSPKLDSVHSTRKGNRLSKPDLDACVKTERDKTAKKPAERLSRGDSEKEKPCKGEIDKVVRRDSERQSSGDMETHSRSDVVREKPSRGADLDKHLRPVKKSNSPNLNRCERQRTMEKRRTHEAIPLNRDLSITDGELV